MRPFSPLPQPGAEYDPDPSTEYEGVFRTGGKITLDDDEAGYIEFDGTAGGGPARGVIEISSSVSAAAYAKVWFRIGDGSAHATVVDSADSDTVDGTTGTLATGTSGGTDGNITVSADTASNRIYIKKSPGKHSRL
ncbi:MAG: hypothetical protein RIB03_06650 [Henriciella sp.]|uniref:hypothetical protein n=1 Tax=Henriciella sp. TaxID=1968823 RepID=UPI0032EF5B7C